MANISTIAATFVQKWFSFFSLPNITDNLAIHSPAFIPEQSQLSLGGEVKVEAGVESVETQLTLEVIKGGRLCLLRLSEGLLRLSEGLLRLSKGLLRLSEGLLRLLEGLLRLLEGLCGEGRLEGLLLELEGGVGLLLLDLLRLGREELGVGGISRVDEGVHALTVSAGGH